jgi:hypothetical protein
VFAWLDGLCIVASMGAFAAVIGGATLAALAVASRIAGGIRFDWKVLSMTLVPLGGIGLFLGLSMLTVSQLRGEHIAIAHLATIRAALLVAGVAWSAWLAVCVVADADVHPSARVLALVLYMIPLALVAGAWHLVFWRW